MYVGVMRPHDHDYGRHDRVPGPPVRRRAAQGRGAAVQAAKLASHRNHRHSEESLDQSNLSQALRQVPIRRLIGWHSESEPESGWQAGPGRRAASLSRQGGRPATVLALARPFSRGSPIQPEPATTCEKPWQSGQGPGRFSRLLCTGIRGPGGPGVLSCSAGTDEFDSEARLGLSVELEAILGPGGA